jgi:ceramide glucosyltransferase
MHRYFNDLTLSQLVPFLMTGLIAFAILVFCLVFGLCCISTLCALRQMRRGREASRALGSDAYISFPVSILKPLKGLEDGIEETLESFFCLDYPRYELVFSVCDPEDPVCPVVQDLMDQYPEVDARLIIGRADVGQNPQNPKVNNLIIPYRLAQFDFILICDSSIKADTHFLRRLASYMKPDVGLVTAVVAGEEGEGVGGALESITLNTFYLKWTYLARLLRLPFFAGKVMLFRRTVADKFGGLSSLGVFLAEDYMLAKSIKSLGLNVAIQAEPVFQEIGYRELSDYWSRNLRWGRIRKSIAPLAVVLEPLAGPAFWSLVLALFLPSWSGFWAALSVWSLWAVADLILIRAIAAESMSQASLTFDSVVAWILRELLVIPLWLHVLVGNTVSWKGTRLRIGQETRLLVPRSDSDLRLRWLSLVKRQN